MGFRLNEKRLYEIFLKTLPSEVLVETMLRENSTRFLVLEKLEQKDVEELRSGVESVSTGIRDNITAAREDGLNSLADYLESLNKGLDKARAFVTKLDLNDSEGALATVKQFFGKKWDIPRAIQGVLDIQTKSNGAVETLSNAVELLNRNLEGKLEDSQKLSDINPESGVTPEDLKAGVAKAFKASKPSGILGKIGSFFKKNVTGSSIPGVEEVGELPVEALADELLQMQYGKFKSFMADAEQAASEAESEAIPGDVAQDIVQSAEVGEGEASAEPTGEDAELGTAELEKAEEKADQVAGALGSLPFGKASLTKILKSMPDIVGKGNKATASRRAFRKAVNDAAGTQIFEESLLKKDQNQDELLMDRWRKLAGLN